MIIQRLAIVFPLAHLSCFDVSLFLSHSFYLSVSTVQKLQELKEYMDNKEMTMGRIKELEDLLSNERVIFENKVKEFREQMEQERQQYVIFEDITRR